MRNVAVVGRVSAEVLGRLPNFTSDIKGEQNLEIVFVMRPAHDFPIGTAFRIRQGTTTNTLKLVAATQQFDKPMDAIPAGWNTICAFRRQENTISILAGLPYTNDWYGNETALVLEEMVRPA